MRKRCRWGLWVLLALLVISIGVAIWLILVIDRAMIGPPHRIRAYTRILETLPAPSGWQSQTDHLWLSGTGTVDGYRSYKVAESYEQILEFFRIELSQQGWSLLQSKHHNESVGLLFYSEEHHCLKISIGKRVINEAGTRRVSINVREELNKNLCKF